MTSEEVRQLVEQQINGRWDLRNDHNCDLRKCLVVPKKKKYLDPDNEYQEIEFWLVLEEDPETRNGYKIIYDEKEGMFGLAAGPETEKYRHPVFIGYYGDFPETYMSM
jgi:hypothetical protein